MKNQEWNTMWRSRYGLLALLLCLFGITMIIRRPEKFSPMIAKKKQREQAQKYKKLLQSLGISPTYAEIIVAQSAHETAGWTSSIYVNNNNAFGMRHPAIRRTVSLGSKNGYAHYNSVEDSFRDYILWTDYARVPNTVKNSISAYCEFLKMRKYYEDSFENYARGVTYWYMILFEG